MISLSRFARWRAFLSEHRRWGIVALLFFFSVANNFDRQALAVLVPKLKEELAFGPQNPTSGTPLPHRVHRVQPGETLDRIAAMHYGDSTKWRAIASANGVEDPLALRPGGLLSIPRLD